MKSGESSIIQYLTHASEVTLVNCQLNYRALNPRKIVFAAVRHLKLVKSSVTQRLTLVTEILLIKYKLSYGVLHHPKISSHCSDDFASTPESTSGHFSHQTTRHSFPTRQTQELWSALSNTCSSDSEVLIVDSLVRHSETLTTDGSKNDCALTGTPLAENDCTLTEMAATFREDLIQRLERKHLKVVTISFCIASIASEVRVLMQHKGNTKATQEDKAGSLLVKYEAKQDKTYKSRTTPIFFWP